MFAKITCAHIIGIEAFKVDVEVDISNVGLPSFSLVGLAEGAVKESRERVKSALKNIDYNVFTRPITVNLAPADLKKDGSHYDLPIAVGLIAAAEPDEIDTSSTLFVGELSLDGCLRGISGVLCICSWASENGIKRVVVPKDNVDEALLIDGIEVYALEHLSQVIALIKKDSSIKSVNYDKGKKVYNLGDTHYDCDFSEVKGQFAARRAAEVAAAGLHNIVMVGSPGSGKTMIARRIPTILPDMSQKEALLTTKIHSVAGLLKKRGQLITERPFIAPHHTASNIAIIGGGSKAMPGHVSICTNGILFLDEFLEFKRSVLEVLRQPMEDRIVTISRAGKTVTYPASFMLVAACNPCPCGYLGDDKKECTCNMSAIDRYKSKMSGPMLDRIDIQIRIAGVSYIEIQDGKPSESSAKIRSRVEKAHRIQQERFIDTDIAFNSQMRDKDIAYFCELDSISKKLLQNAMEKFSLSARGYNKIIKVARTIADLNGSSRIHAEHVAESLQYRISF